MRRFPFEVVPERYDASQIRRFEKRVRGSCSGRKNENQNHCLVSSMLCIEQRDPKDGFRAFDFLLLCSSPCAQHAEISNHHLSHRALPTPRGLSTPLFAVRRKSSNRSRSAGTRSSFGRPCLQLHQKMFDSQTRIDAWICVCSDGIAMRAENSDVPLESTLLTRLSSHPPDFPLWGDIFSTFSRSISSNELP